ncbi:MAG: hypothetical protein KKD64_11515 [Alphaproteobacteria bacterium]|nr:hypothetical protein [Alphaproteobacteria bacterium]MBU0794030.1 hypothetical protein [Alphaproteobacteria bacterium]MBU0877401.1 hypothetical protein [Alphaproteobacteria bacterium]MBU1770268.1 hypothetical protein [Alphaproteobacteria bacterium]
MAAPRSADSRRKTEPNQHRLGIEEREQFIELGDDDVIKARNRRICKIAPSCDAPAGSLDGRSSPIAARGLRQIAAN